MTLEYIIGQNANDNFKIIDNANEYDMWFHIENYPSCHVICTIPDNLSKKDFLKVIKRGALFCKENSKYKSEKSVSIIYTYVKNLTKTDIIGTVITTNTKSIKI
jgi:predicted ribosome quality control (RQC) complex YloA/Tae2 family protein